MARRQISGSGLYGNTPITWDDSGSDPPQEAQDRLAASRARQDQLSAISQAYANQRQEGQQQAALQQQAQTGRERLAAFGAQQDAARQDQSLQARAYESDADRQQRAAQEAERLKWSTLEQAGQQYEGEQARGQADTHFQQQRADEFNALNSKQNYDAQRLRFEADRTDQREDFRALDERDMLERRQAYSVQDQMLQFRARAELQNQELSQSEQMRLQKLRTAKAAVMEDLQSGKIDQGTANDMILHLQTGIDPLQQRHVQSTMMHQQMQDELLLHQSAKQQAIEQQNAKFASSSFQDRTYKDPESGEMFFQTEPGKWTHVKQGVNEQQQRLQEHQQFQMQRQDNLDQQEQRRRDSLLERSQNHWDAQQKQAGDDWHKAYTTAAKHVDAQIKAQRQMEDAANQKAVAEAKAAGTGEPQQSRTAFDRGAMLKTEMGNMGFNPDRQQHLSDFTDKHGPRPGSQTVEPPMAPTGPAPSAGPPANNQAPAQQPMNPGAIQPQAAAPGRRPSLAEQSPALANRLSQILDPRSPERYDSGGYQTVKAAERLKNLPYSSFADVPEDKKGAVLDDLLATGAVDQMSPAAQSLVLGLLKQRRKDAR